MTFHPGDYRGDPFPGPVDALLLSTCCRPRARSRDSRSFARPGKPSGRAGRSWCTASCLPERRRRPQAALFAVRMFLAFDEGRLVGGAGHGVAGAGAVRRARDEVARASVPEHADRGLAPRVAVPELRSSRSWPRTSPPGSRGGESKRSRCASLRCSRRPFLRVVRRGVPEPSGPPREVHRSRVRIAPRDRPAPDASRAPAARSRPRAGAGVEARRRPQSSSARIVFDDGSALLLIEHGTEKRARLWLTDDPDALPELRSVRPDPTRRAGRARVSPRHCGRPRASSRPSSPTSARSRDRKRALRRDPLRGAPVAAPAHGEDERRGRAAPLPGDRLGARAADGTPPRVGGRGAAPAGSRSSTTPCTTGRGPRARGAGARSLGSRTRTGRRSTARGARPEEEPQGPKALQAVEMSPGASASGRRIAADTKG